MDATAAEPLIKCAFISGLLLPEVTSQLKAAAAVQKLDLKTIVTHSRIVLSTRNGGSDFVREGPGGGKLAASLELEWDISFEIARISKNHQVRAGAHQRSVICAGI